MTKYDGSIKINDLAQDLTENLRGEEDDFLYGTSSFLNAISRYNKSRGKKWNKYIIYEKGDIVTYEGNIFVSLANGNINMNPIESNTYWKFAINPYQNNKAKIKAYVRHEGTNIVDSYNIAALQLIDYRDIDEFYMDTKITSIPYVFRFYFLNPMSEKPVFSTSTNSSGLSGGDVNLPSVKGLGVENTIGYTTIRYPTYIEIQRGNQYYDLVDPITYFNASLCSGTIIWYDSTDFVP